MSNEYRTKIEYSSIKRDPWPGLYFDFSDSLSTFQGYFLGPPDSPYSGKVFKTNWEIPTNYPWQPPKITFESKIFHPNISQTGEINIDILKTGWSPALNYKTILLSLCSLLENPDLSCPLNSLAGCYFKEDKMLFRLIARDWTVKFALDNSFGLRWID